jgi:ribonuclease P/MRP protein subunit RPP1
MKQLVFLQNKEIENKLKIETEKIEVIDTSSEKLRSEIQKCKGLVVIQGGDDKINRLAVENRKVDLLLSPEKGTRKDSMFFRNSGLNQVLCKLAFKNKISIGFNFSDILNSKDKLKIISRMVQNVKLCKKYKVKMVFSSFAKSKYELRSNAILASFAKLLGV